MAKHEELPWKTERRKWVKHTIEVIVEQERRSSWLQSLRQGDHDKITLAFSEEEEKLRLAMEAAEDTTPRFTGETVSLLKRIAEVRRATRTAISKDDNPLSLLDHPPFEDLLLPYGLIIANVEGTDQTNLDWKRIGIEHTLDLLSKAVEASDSPQKAAGYRRGNAIDIKRADFFYRIQQRWEGEQSDHVHSKRRALPKRVIAEIVFEITRSPTGDPKSDVARHLNETYKFSSVAEITSLLTSVSNGKVRK